MEFQYIRHTANEREISAPGYTCRMGKAQTKKKPSRGRRWVVSIMRGSPDEQGTAGRKELCRPSGSREWRKGLD